MNSQSRWLMRMLLGALGGALFVATDGRAQQEKEKRVSKELLEQITAALDKGVKYLKENSSSPERKKKGQKEWEKKREKERKEQEEKRQKEEEEKLFQQWRLDPAYKKYRDDRVRQWAKAQVQAQGRFSRGIKVLVCYAMLKGGLPKEDKLLQQEKKEWIDLIENPLLVAGTYEAGIAAMFLAEYGDKESLQALQRLAEAMAAMNQWGGYLIGKPADNKGGAGVEGKVRLPKPEGNLSCMQYAILGLQAATNRGCKISPEIFKDAEHQLLEAQNEDGGWGYNLPSGSSYGSMTAAGVASLVICRSHLAVKDNPKMDKQAESAIQKGLDWLGKGFSVWDTGPFKRNGYYLYSIERAGCFAQVEKMGEHFWYKEGAEQLMKTQQADGCWEDTSGGEDNLIASAFAVLFLARASEGFVSGKPSGKLKKDEPAYTK